LIPKLNPEVFGTPHYLTALLDRARTPQATEYLNNLFKTETTKVQVGYQLNYIVRREVSGVPTKKTGKQYTYVDVNGTVRNGGEWPK